MGQWYKSLDSQINKTRLISMHTKVILVAKEIMYDAGVMAHSVQAVDLRRADAVGARREQNEVVAYYQGENLIR